MKKYFFTSLIFLYTCALIAQSNFEKGYFIDIQGIRTEGYLKLINFAEINKSKFSGLEFKPDLDQKVVKLQNSNIKEFGLGKELKMVKYTVDLEVINLYKEIDIQKEVVYNKSTVFLNVILEGKANLYTYEADNYTKYFIKNTSDIVPIQLIYKKYIVEGTYHKENNEFREQLFRSIKCDNQTTKDFLNIRYDKKSLISIFENYNKCQNSDYFIYSDKFKKSTKINFTAYLGGYLNTFYISSVHPNTETSSNLTFGLGVEAEMVLPSENWSLFVSADYNYLNTEITAVSSVSEFNKTRVEDIYSYDSGFIDIVLGGRWYQSLNSSAKIFLGAGLGINSPLGNLSQKQTLTVSTAPDFLFIENFEYFVDASIYLNLQVGYQFDNHYGVDFIFDTKKTSFLAGKEEKYSNFSRFGLNLRYTF